MDITSLLLAEWFLWVRGAALAAAGYVLCRRRNYAAVIVALLAAYWAYNSLSLMIRFRTELLEQAGLGYVIQACTALLLPFGLMALGLLIKWKQGAEPAASPNVGPAAPAASSSVGKGSPSVS